MKIVLTGASGFIGSCFLWKLNAMGIDDVVIVDTADKLGAVPNLAGKKFSGYLSKKELLAKLDGGGLKDRDAIVHIGACADTTEKDLKFLAENNTEYSKTLARWALANGKAFHYASSAAVYGDGKQGYSDADADCGKYRALNPYGQSKLDFDKWVISEGISNRVVGYRYFNVFGPNEYHKGEMRSMVAKAYEQIVKTGKARLFATSRPGFPDGSEERDFVYVKDICQVMAFFLQNPQHHGIFNLGTGQARSFKDLVLAVFAAMGQPPEIDYIPMPEALRGQYQYFTQADISKLRKLPYNEPFPRLDVSILDYVKYHLMRPNAHL
jgi:ADP-L-glycero-D-manno-heptose 6-epimerase